MVFVGVFLAYVVGAYVNFRWSAVVCLALSLLSIVTSCLFLTETPRWLMSRGRRNEARGLLFYLGGAPPAHPSDPAALEVDRQLAEIEANLLLTASRNVWAELGALFRPPFLRPLLIVQGLMILQQFTGPGFIKSYAFTIFTDSMGQMAQAGSFFGSPHYQSMVIGAANILGNVVSMFLIDRCGRRGLLWSASCLALVAHGALGAFYFVREMRPAFALDYLFWVPLTSLILFSTIYGLAIGNVPFVLNYEYFPTRLRGVASGLGQFNHNLFFFVVVKAFGGLLVGGAVPSYVIFWSYAGVSLVLVVFVVAFVAETKGLSLEEVELRWYPEQKDGIAKIRNGTVPEVVPPERGGEGNKANLHGTKPMGQF